MGIEAGDYVTNTKDTASCPINEVTEYTIFCSDGLPNGAAWDEGDVYELNGVGVAKR